MKYIPYGRQSIDGDDIKEVVKVLKSDWLTQGPMVQRFEEALAKYCGVKYVVTVSSGTAALHLACLVAGLKKGDEAITSPITFLATSNAVLYTGAKPAFADIDYDTVNIDPEEIRKNITKKTKAILPVHFAGLPCDMPEIAIIARKHNLIVIEDACHALGAEYKADGRWVKVGSCRHSDMTILSFHPVKHITTGEGGAITTNDRKIYETLKALRAHGVYKDKNTAKKGPWYYEMRELGFNYRITDFQCALGISQLKKIERFLYSRKRIADLYNKELEVFSDRIELPCETGLAKNARHLYVIKIDFKKIKQERKLLMEKLKKMGILTQVHYIPVYHHPYYRNSYKIRAKDFPISEEYYRKALSLPIYSFMENKKLNHVIEALKLFLR